MPLRQPVAENAIHRKGYQPFRHTIGDLLDQLALRSLEDAFVRHELEQRREKRKTMR